MTFAVTTLLLCNLWNCISSRKLKKKASNQLFINSIFSRQACFRLGGPLNCWHRTDFISLYSSCISNIIYPATIVQMYLRTSYIVENILSYTFLPKYFSPLNWPYYFFCRSLTIQINRQSFNSDQLQDDVLISVLIF